MSKKTKTVEERIRDNYQAEDGIWLVQAGKVTEAKLLKEAYERIISLKNDRNFWYDRYRYDDRYNNQKKEIRDLSIKLEKEKEKNKNLLKKYESIKNAVAEIELLRED